MGFNLLIDRMDDLRIGGMTLDRNAARQWASIYLTSSGTYAYPAYDGYESAGASGPLTEADLLAPILLNARVSIRSFYNLRAVLPDLQDALDAARNVSELAESSDEDLDLLASLFRFVDKKAIWGAQGTVLSKVLHRKHPSFIPLYDANLSRVYQDGDGPVPRKKGRSWSEFIVPYASAVRDDLVREADFWNEIVLMAPTARITPLRALDIVAWRAGAPGNPLTV